MSVIFFDARELGNIAGSYAVASSRARHRDPQDQTTIDAMRSARDFATGAARACKASEIAEQAPGVGRYDLKSAIGTMRLLAYNASESRDFLPASVKADLCEIACELASAAIES